MNSSNKKSLFILATAIVIAAGMVTTGFSEDNARQASLQGSSDGTTANTITITSDNTIKGDMKATKDSTISVGDVDVANTDAKTIDIYTENHAAGVTADNDGHVAIGRVGVSNVSGANLVKVTTTNKVTGSVTAKDHSSATIGTVNVH